MRGYGPKNPKIMSVRADAPISRLDTSKYLSDEKMMSQAFWECLRDNEPEEAIDVIATYLEAINKSKFSKENDIPRATLYRGLKRKNLTIKTLAKILHSLS